MNLFVTFYKDNRLSEAANVWNKFNNGNDDSLNRNDVTPKARRYFNRVIKNHLKFFNKTRFLNKCPNNSIKIDYLNEIFPDAIFIHMIRDGRAATYSLMKKQERKDYYRGVKPPGWNNLLDKTIIEKCALQWKMTTEYTLESAKILPPERYMEVRYEDFVLQPFETLTAVGNKCGLVWDRDYLEELVRDLENRNFKWHENLTPSEIERLNDLLGDLLTKLGYEV